MKTQFFSQIAQWLKTNKYVLLQRRYCVLLISLYLVTKKWGLRHLRAKKKSYQNCHFCEFPRFLEKQTKQSEPGDHSILWLKEWSTEQFKDCELTKPTYTCAFNMTIFSKYDFCKNDFVHFHHFQGQNKIIHISPLRSIRLGL